jgi:Arc/MetJ-type ribon-helix-helix transcriptional regulator
MHKALPPDWPAISSVNMAAGPPGNRDGEPATTETPRPCTLPKDKGPKPGGPGMVIGMAAKKVTVTLDETQLDRIRALVAAGTAASVSGFVQHAVGVALDDVSGWGALLAEALRETGGALSDSERAWADEVLGTGGRSAA